MMATLQKVSLSTSPFSEAFSFYKTSEKDLSAEKIETRIPLVFTFQILAEKFAYSDLFRDKVACL